MINTIKELLRSKKAVVAIVTTLALILGLFGIHIDVPELVTAVSPLYVYIIGQGLADKGKEAAKVNAAADTTRASLELQTASELKQLAAIEANGKP